MDSLPSLEVYLNDFRLRLKSAGFSPRDSESMRWEGTLRVEWKQPESGDWLIRDHPVAIILPPGFPYHAPIVISLDEPVLERSWHLAPSYNLCLWREPGGWNPFMSAQKLLGRIHEWYIHYHMDDWPEDFAPTDLHLYLPKEGLVVIGDEWLPDSAQSVGQFILWRNTKYPNTPCLVGLKADIKQRISPEKRLVDSLNRNNDHDTNCHGVWFRVNKPFVPASRLNILMNQIDQASGYSQGKSLSLLISFLTRVVSGKGIPIAIGYPGLTSQENWLFLWIAKPIGKNLHLSSATQNAKVEIHSFEVAPARKADMIRRTIHTSQKLDGKKVALFGVGSLGGSVAILLAKAGLGTIRIVDSDYIRPANAIRHEAGTNWTGIRKTFAIQTQIRHHNPDCTVDIFDEEWDQDKILEIVKGVDLIVDTTANVSFSLWLNQIAVEKHIPILFASAYRRAAIGRLILRRENELSKDPCLACYFLSEKQWQEELFPIIRPDAGSMFGEEGCAVVTEEADAINIETIACLTAKTILNYFSGNETGTNLFLFVSDPLLDGHGILAKPGLHKLTNQAIKDCPICGYTRNK